jgi:hypothetical protein
MATAAKAIRLAPTRDEWEARAIELAEREHLTGTARQLAAVPLREFYGVRKSGPVGEYVVRVEFWYGGELRRIACTCPAGERGRACKHAGAVLHTLRLRERAISQPDTDPLASWRRGGEW